MTRILTALGLAAITIAGGALAAPDLVPVRSGDDAGIEVKLCDDETTLRIAADTPSCGGIGGRRAWPCTWLPASTSRGCERTCFARPGIGS